MEIDRGCKYPCRGPKTHLWLVHVRSRRYRCPRVSNTVGQTSLKWSRQIVTSNSHIRRERHPPPSRM